MPNFSQELWDSINEDALRSHNSNPQELAEWQGKISQHLQNTGLFTFDSNGQLTPTAEAFPEPPPGWNGSGTTNGTSYASNETGWQKYLLDTGWKVGAPTPKVASERPVPGLLDGRATTGTGSPQIPVNQPAPSPTVDPSIEAARIRAAADAELFRLNEERQAADRARTEQDCQRSAFDSISSVLNRYGLGGLAPWARGLIQEGSTAARVELELYDQPTFQERFPAIFTRQESGLAPISPAEYIEYEQVAGQMMRQAGFPPGFYDSPTDFTKLIGADVSVSELSDRVLQSFRDVGEGDENVRNAYTQFFGVNGIAALAAYHLDPNVAAPVLERQAQTARIAGAAWSIDIDIQHTRAEDLVDRRISEAEAFAGFRQLNELRSLFDETLGEGTDLDIAREGVDATFGLSSTATRVLETRRRGRVNSLRGGGGALIESSGVIGLGTS